MPTHTTTLATIALWLPRLFSGQQLHRMALEAAHAGEPLRAAQLFEAAALDYRRDLRVEALARLRTHELMAKARAGVAPEQEAALLLDIERRLSSFETIESLDPPFRLVEARALLAQWSSDAEHEHEPLRQAA